MSILQWVWLVFSMLKWLYEIIKKRQADRPLAGPDLMTSAKAAFERVCDTGRFGELDKFVDDNGLRLDFERARVLKTAKRRERRRARSANQ